MNICVFGDSITEGYYDDEKGGWVNRLKEELSCDKIYNLGISGDTTEDLLERFDHDIAGKNLDLIIFAIGINDSEFIISINNQLVILEKFEENIRKLVEKSKEITGDVIFIGPTAVEEDKTSPIAWNADVVYKNSDIEKYNDKLKEICEKENLKFIDIHEEMQKIDYKKMLTDGLHPNAEGHKWIAEKIIKELIF
jgi:acyl-CoA thioesterase I